MAVSNHPASCRCANCRAQRATTKVPVPPSGQPSKPVVLPLDDPNKLPDKMLQAIKKNPVKTVLSWKSDDITNAEITRRLSLAEIPNNVIRTIMKEVNEEWEAGRRRRGIWEIAWGIGIILITLLLVEGVVWLVTGRFGAYGFIDVIGIGIGWVFIVRGTYQVLTSKKKATTT